MEVSLRHVQGSLIELSSAAQKVFPILCHSDFAPLDAGVVGEPMPIDDGFGEDAVPVTPGEKPRFEGTWSCSTCDSTITSLPFQPRDTSNLKCLDCFKASKA